MRKLKIATIIFLTGAAVCLGAILALAVGGADSGGDGGNGWGIPGKYRIVLEKEVPAEEIHSLKIDYGMTYNDVFFYQGEGDSVLIREYMNFEPQEKQISKVEQNGGEIRVKGVKRNRFAIFSFDSRDAYTEIWLPKGFAESLEEVSVRTVGGDVRAEVGFEGKLFSVSSTSGDIRLSEVRAEELKASSTSGNIKSDTLAGQITVSTTSGDISLGQAEGNTKISSTSGDVLASEVQGDVAVSTTSGEITLGEVDGNMDLSTTSGEIRLQKGKGRFACESTSGDVRLERLEGAFRISTSSGEISLLEGKGYGETNSISGDVKIFLEELAGDLTVSTTSGEVQLQFPESVSLTLDFDSSSGDCNTFFDKALQFNKRGNQAKGEYGGGDNEVNVSTVSGDLRIRER